MILCPFGSPFDRYESMLEAFAKMVRGEMENPYSYDYELMLFKTLIKCCGGSYGI